MWRKLTNLSELTLALFKMDVSALLKLRTSVQFHLRNEERIFYYLSSQRLCLSSRMKQNDDSNHCVVILILILIWVLALIMLYHLKTDSRK